MKAFLFQVKEHQNPARSAYCLLQVYQEYQALAFCCRSQQNSIELTLVPSKIMFTLQSLIEGETVDRLQDREEATWWQMRLNYTTAQQVALLGLVLTTGTGKET